MVGLGPRSRRCAELMSRARAVLVPSVWEETFGLVVVEAMAAGYSADRGRARLVPELITPGSTACCSGRVTRMRSRWPSPMSRRTPRDTRLYGSRPARPTSSDSTRRHSLKHLLEIYRFAIAHPVWRAAVESSHASIRRPDQHVQPEGPESPPMQSKLRRRIAHLADRPGRRVAVADHGRGALRRPSHRTVARTGWCATARPPTTPMTWIRSTWISSAGSSPRSPEPRSGRSGPGRRNWRRTRTSSSS